MPKHLPSTTKVSSPSQVLAVLNSRPISNAALHQADTIRNVILSSSSHLALKPVSQEQLEHACIQMMQINSWGHSLRTVMQDNSSNWRYWTDWCRTWSTPPVRSYYHSTANQEDRMVENYLWTSALPWVLSRMSPGWQGLHSTFLSCCGASRHQAHTFHT